MKFDLSSMIKKISDTQKIVLIFIAVIVTGTAFLMLPFSTKSGVSPALIDALFVATSATCVTGLVPMDTYNFWSPFGQVVILVLIQIGGLGLMTIATIYAFFLNRAIGLKDRLFLSQSFNFDTHAGVVKIVKLILKGTFLVEGVGALLLAIKFVPQFGLGQGVTKAVFHSVSAFCNAGFDIMGDIGEFSSFTTYVKDPIVSLVIPVLIIIGGIGFFIWSDLLKYKDNGRFKLSLHSKVALTMTAFLVISGTIFTFLFEYNNSLTMADLNIFEKILASFFHSVTLRTAGFNNINIGDLKSATLMISILYMFIGASPGSTGGGVKTTTFAAIVLATKAVILGREDVSVMGRRLEKNIISRSIAIVIMSFGVVFLGIILISISQPELAFVHVIFEVVSAFGTVGLSMGITPHLSIASKFVIITTMLFGRVGILTVAFALASKHQNYKTSYHYPSQKIMVG